MDDAIWMCNAPIHYCDLPSAANEDDSEQADDYFFSKMSDDTVYYEPAEVEETVQECWSQEVPSVSEEAELFPVIRRRSRSVGSRPLFLKKHEPSVTSNQGRSRGRKMGAPATSSQTRSTKPGVEDPDHHFIEGLRSYVPVKKVVEAPKITKPAPFNLTEPKKKSIREVTAQPSMAEGVQRWEKKTPERFHSMRHGEVFRAHEKFEMRSATEAHTPQLTAVKRHRVVHALSREAQEEREFEEMKKNQFKAHAVDEKVFKAPILPPKKEVKTTKIEPFHLTECHKKENIAPDAEKIDHQFHAKPAPKFEPPVVEPRQPMPVTVPQTPKFSAAGKAAFHSWRRQRSRSNGSLTTSLRSGSSNGSLTSSTTTGSERLKNTVIEPFSFEDRDKMAQRRREMKIKKIMEEEKKKREFHANPCPNFSQPSVPERSTFVATKTVPFKLSCDTIGEKRKEKFLQQMEEMKLEERKAAQFKAQPAKILNKEPFKVKLDQTKSNSLTEVVEFNLSTSKRANERKDFEEFLKEREREKEVVRQQREQERLKKEAENAAKLREETNFHANPIRQYRSIEIKKAEPELLTVPKTPKFMKK